MWGPFAMLGAGYQPGCVKDTAQPGSTRVESGMILQCPWLSASASSAYWLPLPHTGFLMTLSLCRFPSRCLVAERQRRTPSRACTGFYTAMGGQVPRTV